MRSFAYVLGPDGTPLTPSDLPHGGTARWVPRQKAVVVIAVQNGFVSLEAACKRYALSKEEFREWESAYAGFGVCGLRATHRSVGAASGSAKRATNPKAAFFDDEMRM